MNNSHGQQKPPSQQEFVEFLFYFHEISGGHCPVIIEKDGGFHVESDPAKRTIEDMKKWLDIIPSNLVFSAENKNLIKKRNYPKCSQWNNLSIISLTQQGMVNFLSIPGNNDAYGKPSFTTDKPWRDLSKEKKNDIIFDAVLEEEEGLLDAIQEFSEKDNNSRKCFRKAGDAARILWRLLIEKPNNGESDNKVSILEIWMKGVCPMFTISSKRPSGHPQHLTRLDFKNTRLIELNKWLKQKTCFKHTITDIIRARRNISSHNRPFLDKCYFDIKDEVDAIKWLEFPKPASPSDRFIIAIARYILWWLWRIHIAKKQKPCFSSLVQTYQL